VAWLLALHTGRLYPPGEIPGTQLCQRLNRPHCHGVVGRITSMKTCDLPACIAVLQQNAPPRAPRTKKRKAKLSKSQIMYDITQHKAPPGILTWF